MDVEKLTTNPLSDDDVLFLERVMIDVRSFVDILRNTEEKKKVLLFPPVNNFRRFLVHQLVDKTFSEQNLKTISIGRLYARRTVVYPAPLYLTTQVIETKSGYQNNPSLIVQRSPVLRIKPRTMSSTPDSRTRKGRKPDMQIYVPRGRRMLDASRRDQQAESFIETEMHPKNDSDNESFSEITLSTENWDAEFGNSNVTELDTSESWDSEIGNNSIALDTSKEDNVNNDEKDIVLGTPIILPTKSEDKSPVKLCTPEDWSVEIEDNLAIISNTPTGGTKNKSNVKIALNMSENQSGLVKELNTSKISDEESTSWIEQKKEDEILIDLTDGEVERSCTSKIDQIVDKTIDNFVNVTKHASDFVSNTKTMCDSNLENGLLVQNPVSTPPRESTEAETIDRNKIASTNNESEENGLVSSLARSPKSSTSTPKKRNGTMKASECDWEELFDDSGDFVDDSLVAELEKSVGKVKIQRATQDYRSYQTVDERTSDGECIIEVYDFPADYKTDDLFTIFASYRSDQGFQIVWVDDTHALAVFSSPIIADEVLNGALPCVKTRPLKNAIPKSRMKARNLIPATVTRPKTCVSLARRLVSGHLGMKINVTDKQREAERKLLSDAREKRRQVAKQKCEVWESPPSSDRWT